MIVQTTNAGWQIIHQQAHGLLAFQLAMHWQESERPAQWIETLTALLEHDDGQEAWSGTNHLTEAGAPVHFTIKEYSLEQCHQMIDIALRKSRWNALMASRHATFLYESKRGQDPALDEFLDQQVTNQTKWRNAYEATKKEVNGAYDLLQWCDALSLILCLNQLPPDARQLEISKGPDGTRYFVQQRSRDQSLSVDPWPFDKPEFRVHVEMYPVSQLHFSSDRELYNAINDAPAEVQEWIFRK